MGQEMNIVGSQESSASIDSAPYYDRCASIVCSSDVSMRVHFLVLVAVDTLSLFRNLLEQTSVLTGRGILEIRRNSSLLLYKNLKRKLERLLEDEAYLKILVVTVSS